MFPMTRIQVYRLTQTYVHTLRTTHATMLCQHQREPAVHALAAKQKRMRSDESSSPTIQNDEGSSVSNMSCSHSSSHFHVRTDKDARTSTELGIISLIFMHTIACTPKPCSHSSVMLTHMTAITFDIVKMVYYVPHLFD